MKKLIDHERYPGLEGMYFLSGDGLHVIGVAGQSEPDGEFNRQYLDQLNDLYTGMLNISVDDDAVIGWFIPYGEDPFDPPWHNCTLKLRAETFDGLAGFEIALADVFEKLELTPKIAVARAMSAYEGMRKLVVYGMALGYLSLLINDCNGVPVVVRISEKDVAHDFWSALKQRVKESHLYQQCEFRPLIESLMDGEKD